MKCPNCENFVDEKAMKCPYCGYTLRTELKAKPEAEKKTAEDTQKKEKKNGKKDGKKSGKSSGTVKFILLIAVAVCIFFAISKSGSGDQGAPAIAGSNTETETSGEPEMTTTPETDSEPELSEEPVQEGFIFADSDRRYLTEDEIEGLTQEEMRIARNELYARRGRRFLSEDLQSYFDSQEWYNGSIEPGDFVESSLNEYETYNRDLILRIETAKGYH